MEFEYMEDRMLSRENFVSFILDGPKATIDQPAQEEIESALPEGFEGFATEETQIADTGKASFALRLVEASGFGPAQYLEREEVILGDDAAAKYLPTRVYYWPKMNSRPYQTLLFELENVGIEFLKAPVFRDLKGQEILEDGLSRLVQMSLRGFERGGAKRTAAVMQGQQKETLCIISIPDDRDRDNEVSHLTCLGTVSADQGSLEVFHIREEARYWERQLAEDHLSRLYDRHFKKLASGKWQDAFITGEERKLARKMLDVCTTTRVSEKKIQNSVVDLLEEIAKGFGLRRKKDAETRLTAFDLPADHDIGVDSEGLVKKAGKNPFEGMTLRDERNRLLGYIIYCLDEKHDATELRSHLEHFNRFHNVLVIYPNGNHAILELWQGKRKLEGKLTKQGATFEGEGQVVNLLSRFFVVSKAKVRNPAELAKELAFRARFLRNLAVRQLKTEKKEGDLRELFNSFKKALLHDQTEDEFADAYAQTLTYGLLSARWVSQEEYSKKGVRFTRKEALRYMPKTSPFLKSLFSSVLQANFESQLVWLLDDIADLLDRVEIDSIFQGSESISTHSSDPVIHFYEPFLSAYDPNLKKVHGVYYTPKPVVSSLVVSIHEILRKDLKIKDGLADTVSWREVCQVNPNWELPDSVKPDEPFIKILDPAIGTGTFIIEVINCIYRTLMEKWTSEGYGESSKSNLWAEYVDQFLIPRICGFELMVAPYVICHMRIELALRGTGYKIKRGQRLNVYLTNSLEQDRSSSMHLFPDFIAKEYSEANEIKSKRNMTVILGNPPYSNSTTKNEWIMDLIKPYKEGLNEKKTDLNREEWKFIRVASYYSSPNTPHILGYIINNAILKAITHRQMRRVILDEYSKLHVLNLHGSSKPPEQVPVGVQEDQNIGEIDKNVFDIQQGVTFLICDSFCQNAAIEDARILYGDLWGTRERKLGCLGQRTILDHVEKTLSPKDPYWFFIEHDDSFETEFNQWSSLTDIFTKHISGIQSGRDGFVSAIDRGTVEKRVQDIIRGRSWEEVAPGIERPVWNGFSFEKFKNATKKDIGKFIKEWLVLPFDVRPLIYHPSIIKRMRGNIMESLTKENIGFCSVRQLYAEGWHHIFVVNSLVSDTAISNKSREYNYVFPLTIHNGGNIESEESRGNNINPVILESVVEKIKTKPVDLFHYIYGILHSGDYRSRYAAQLRTDFPRIPFPKDSKLFTEISKLGVNLVSLHLLDASYPKCSNHIKDVLEKSFLELKVSNSNTFVSPGHPKFSKGRIYLNKNCYIDSVREDIWNYRIGGYQICHKWLKDRKSIGQDGSMLTEVCLDQYRKVLTAISESIKSSETIDTLIVKFGGWPNAFRPNSL
jgi:type I restriction-modification system DNA methylase subunit